MVLKDLGQMIMPAAEYSLCRDAGKMRNGKYLLILSAYQDIRLIFD